MGSLNSMAVSAAGGGVAAAWNQQDFQPPVGVLALAGDQTATVRWAPPRVGNVSSYTVSAAGVTAQTVSAYSVQFAGLTNGVAKTFSVVANYANGSSLPVASGAITPSVQPGGLSIPDLAVWLKADAISGPPADGAAVNIWTDSSGNAFSANKTVGGFNPPAPTFLAAFANGKPALTFGSGAGLALPLNFNTDLLGTEATVFVVCDCTASQNSVATRTQAVISNQSWPANPTFDDQGGFLIDTFGPGTPANYWRVRSAYGPNCNMAFALNTPTLLSVECPAVGRAGFAFKNGSKLLAPNVPPLLKTPNLWTIGRTVAGFYHYTGRIAEIIIYARHLTVPERQAVQAYLGAKYAITVATE